MTLTIVDAGSRIELDLARPDQNARRFGTRWRDGVLDLVGAPIDARTAEHYSTQWGKDIDFQGFARANPEAMKVTPGKQLGWADFFDRVRRRAQQGSIKVYDAACGFGGVMDELFRDPVPPGLFYLGADVHGSLSTIRRPPGASPSQVVLVRWDISSPLPVAERFDAVICRASIHHTVDPPHTFQSLCSVLAPGGAIAVSAYALKGHLRETIDDALRRQIAPMSTDQAFKVAREFSLLGKAMQEVTEKVEIGQDLEWLGIPKGRYGVHELIYDCMMKCWFNKSFGDRYSDVVNFDWYHPSYAYRYRMDELSEWFTAAGLTVKQTASTKAQHYLMGVKGASDAWG